MDAPQPSDWAQQIEAAGAQPSAWPAVVAALAQAMGGTCALLCTPWMQQGGSGFWVPWRMTESHLAAYMRQQAQHDVWAHAAQRLGLFSDGAVFCDPDLVPQRELLGSVYFQAVLRPMGVGRLCSGVVFGGAPGLPTTTLSVYRAPNDPFGAPQRELMASVLPHLSRALGLMHRLQHARWQAKSLRSALHRMGLGVLLLDADLHLIFANQAAQQVLDRADGLSLDAQRRLQAAAPPNDGGGPPLQAWLAQRAAAALAQRGSFAHSYAVARSQAPFTYCLEHCALETTDALALNEGARHIVFVTDPGRVYWPSPDVLQRHLGLTPAQARVAYAVAPGGNTHAELAKTLAITADTARVRLKAIYAKTHTTDTGTLRRLLLSLASARV